MTPVYERDGVRLYAGDCRDVMPTLVDEEIGAVVTDPPYGISYVGSTGSKNSISTTGKRFTRSIEGDDQPFDPSPWLDFPLVAFTGAQYFYDRLPPGGSLHVWNKRGHYRPLDHGDGDVIWINRASACRVFDLVWRGICRHAEHDQKIVHPTQKPVALMAWMLEMLGVPEGATVLDPFAGSASTLVACLKTGRKGIGIEIDDRYIAPAIRRLEGAATPLFDQLTTEVEAC
jgi:site-specific DNA-methyltransferase (adenine-specific)